MKTAVFLAVALFGGPLPAVQPQARIFKAGDFGVRPNSGQDESQAFAKDAPEIVDLRSAQRSAAQRPVKAASIPR